MTTSISIRDERLARVERAIRFEKQDRPVIAAFADAWAARIMKVPLDKYIFDPIFAAGINVEAAKLTGEVDMNILTVPPASGGFAAAFLANLKLPGRDLPVDADWQIDEVGLMEESDYDTIINQGYFAWHQKFFPAKLPVGFSDFQRFIAAIEKDYPKVIQMNLDAGMLPVGAIQLIHPFESFSTARGMATFFKDLRRIPEKVEAAMQRYTVEWNEVIRQQVAATHEKVVFIGCARAAGEFLSPKMHDRFFVPYINQEVECITQAGATAFFHFDSNWTSNMGTFLQLPKQSFVLGSDHGTDMRKAREALGDHGCLLGDVPASLLTLGKPEDVHHYVTDLIRDIGKEGLIVTSGCCTPSNAPLENVKAMVAAVHDC